jgi:hypothetical protein
VRGLILEFLAVGVEIADSTLDFEVYGGFDLGAGCEHLGETLADVLL